MIDLVTITIPDHSVEIGVSSVVVDRAAISPTEGPTPIGAGSVWWHTGAAGESRIDVTFGEWAIAVIQDPGTDAGLHDEASPLRGMPHLGLFVDAYPATAIGGVMLDGGPEVDPAVFLVDSKS